MTTTRTRKTAELPQRFRQRSNGTNQRSKLNSCPIFLTFFCSFETCIESAAFYRAVLSGLSRVNTEFAGWDWCG